MSKGLGLFCMFGFTSSVLVELVAVPSMAVTVGSAWGGSLRRGRFEGGWSLPGGVTRPSCPFASKC